MLTKIEPAEVILALRQLLKSTPRSPIDNDTPTNIHTATDVERYLADVARRASWATCPECGEEWNTLTDEGRCIGCVDKAAKDANRQAQLGDYLRKTIGLYGIERYRFENWDMTAQNALAFERFSAFDWERDNLFLHGPCGTGKTHLAGALLKGVCARNLSVKWVNPMYVSRAIRSRFPSDEEPFVESLVGQDVLIVDDLGVGKDTESTLRLLYEITDKRKARKKNGLVITSNVTLDQLAAKYADDRITSRIAGLCDVIEIDGNDRRIDK